MISTITKILSVILNKGVEIPNAECSILISKKKKITIKINVKKLNAFLNFAGNKNDMTKNGWTVYYVIVPKEINSLPQLIK